MNIAVVGASKNREKFGNKCVRAYKDKGHTVFPINPKEEEIEGIPSYQSIKDIEEPIDTVSLYLPPEVVKTIIDDIIAKKPTLVYFNPGTEDWESEEKLRNARINVKAKCSIIAVGASPADYS